MMLFIECVVCCLLFTLVILPAQYKDPINMIMSYPPKIRKRVEELPQYKGTIKQREKSHVSKKIFGMIFFVMVLSGVAYLSGCRSFSTTFIHVFHAKGACIGMALGLVVALLSGCMIHLICGN